MTIRSIRNKTGLQPVVLLLNRVLYSPLQLPRLTNARSLGTLAFEEVRSEKPHTFTAFVLHGLLGSGRNWRSFSRILNSSLSAYSPPSDWRMVLVDLRNHGKSAEIDSLFPPHDMFNAAKDLANLVKSQGWDWPDAVIGHSMGGKVALQFAESCVNGDYGQSAQVPKQLWVLDSVPGKVNHEDVDGEVEKVLQTLQGLPKDVPSRKWLVDHMIDLGFSKSLSHWIGSNLKKSGEQETWAFNLEPAIQMFNSYRETDYWSLLEKVPKGTEINIVRAENSDRWLPDVLQRLESLDSHVSDDNMGKVFVHVLPNSGHWVHVDNPKGLLEIVTPRIAAMA
ncbi:protein ABHD11 [Impatiens glandulifera]|uniref:protein ABHD11 n=1 Tax=Impatiens glandulifera TaxID=253017 RepID=UPI001FB090C3|nr:protein ABHD11 [Impatiens glandulifera]